MQQKGDKGRKWRQEIKAITKINDTEKYHKINTSYNSQNQTMKLTEIDDETHRK